MTDSPFLTIEQFADYVQIHPMTAYKLCKQKKVKAIKVGSQWRIPKDSFEMAEETLTV